MSRCFDRVMSGLEEVKLYLTVDSIGNRLFCGFRHEGEEENEQEKK